MPFTAHPPLHVYLLLEKQFLPQGFWPRTHPGRTAATEMKKKAAAAAAAAAIIPPIPQRGSATVPMTCQGKTGVDTEQGGLGLASPARSAACGISALPHLGSSA
jgi:hypothetical protein